MQQILTVEQVASYFGKSPRTIRLWITSGKLAARKVGKSYIVTQDAIHEAVKPAIQVVDDAMAVVDDIKHRRAVKEFLAFMQSSSATLADLRAVQEEDILMDESRWLGQAS